MDIKENCDIFAEEQYSERVRLKNIVDLYR